ncbi:dorsalin-1 [Parasteatoda tepidariorum]|uniref:dorsalin-1 n=1 Tax=Parasteatoda tepidariorum TaxID=114398 RepID=UPI00077FA960|nr:dorsalin-1 [Parasteatoda tepidariorum]
MYGSCTAFLTLLVTVAAGHLLDPEAREALDIFKQRMLQELGMVKFPDLKAVNTSSSQMQNMLRKYYRNVRRSEQEIMVLRKTSYHKHTLSFEPDLEAREEIQEARLRFPNATTINVSKEIEQWRESSNPMISIHCSESKCSRARLELLMRRTRVKRAVCTNKCCKKSLRISFKEIGWDWIVQPTDFEAFYCKGRCKDMTDDFASTHALLQSIVKISGKNISRPCCAPKKLRGLDILYYNDKNPPELVLSTQKGMIVKDCACV